MPPHGANLWVSDARAGRAVFSGLTDYWRMDEASGNRVALVGGKTLVPQAAIGSAAGSGPLTGRTVADFPATASAYMQVSYATWDTIPFSFVVWLKEEV